MDRLPISDDEVSLFTPGYNDAPMTNDNRIVNDPDGELPSSVKGRKPARNDPANDLRTRDMERMIRDCVLTGADPNEALDQFGEVLNRMRREYGGTRMGLDGDGADDLPVDDEESDRTNSGGSDEPTLAVIYEVLDNLERAGGKGKSVTASGRVMAEARALLRIICDNLQAVRERNQRRTNVGDDAATNSADAYKEASPAFAAMSLSKRQSEAESEAIFNQLYAKKFAPTQPTK